jgi:uncharacterized protein YfcZ (UPF0381/DUF406 family)
MSEYEALREDIGRTLEAVTHAFAANQRAWTANVDDHTQLWCDIGELRDELHAVANRVESLTRAVTADPAEVAAAIVNDANRSTLREVRGEES